MFSAHDIVDNYFRAFSNKAPYTLRTVLKDLKSLKEIIKILNLFDSVAAIEASTEFPNSYHLFVMFKHTLEHKKIESFKHCVLMFGGDLHPKNVINDYYWIRFGKFNHSKNK